LLVVLILACAMSVAYSCPQTPTQLQAFFDVAQIWNYKINGNASQYLAAFDYFAEDGTFEVNYVGSFHGKTAASEYGLVIYVVPLIDLQSYGIYPTTVEWYAENVITYKFNYSIFLQTPQGTYTFFNLMPTEYITFDPNHCDNPIITYSLTIEDPYAQAVFELASSNKFDYASICGLIGFMCTGANQQYTDFPDCVSKFETVFPVGNEDDAVCPYSLSSNTALCRQNHAVITTVDPPTSANIHCPHTSTDPAKTPCANACLSSCGGCSIVENSPKGYPIRNVSSNAHCIPTYTGPAVSFSCQCLDGTIQRQDLTSPGLSYCQPLTCVSNSSCHSSKGWATCTNGSCAPLNGFSWDATPFAYQQYQTVFCQYGKDRVFEDLNGVPRCVPPGNCILGSPKADKHCKPAHDAVCTRLDSADSIPLGRYGGCICTQLDGTRYPCGF